MRTALCERLSIQIPIIQAAMGGAVGPNLAAAVSNAGGLGMLVLSGAEPDAMRNVIRETRRLTSKPFGVNLNLNRQQADRVAICLEEGVAVISLFWGDPAPLVKQAHDGGAVVLHTAASADEARRVVDGGVDFVVAQGWEAGGHVRGTIATMALIPAVVDAVSPIPVVAAGGIADGRGLAAALALGAAGAWIGTRFLASEEATIHARYQRRILEAKETDTYYTQLFDVGWPEAPHRVLRNTTIDSWEAAGCPPTGARPGEGETVAQTPTGPIVRYRSCTPGPAFEGDIEALPMWCGQGVRLVRDVMPAAAIVREIAEQADAQLQRLSKGL